MKKQKQRLIYMSDMHNEMLEQLSRKFGLGYSQTIRLALTKLYDNEVKNNGKFNTK
jgi:hypothetical protein